MAFAPFLIHHEKTSKHLYQTAFNKRRPMHTHGFQIELHETRIQHHNHSSEYEAIKILMHQWANNYMNVQLLQWSELSIVCL